MQMVEELGVLRRHDQVARPDQHQAARDHLALDQRQGRLGDVAPALAKAEVDLLLAGILRFGARLAEAAELEALTFQRCIALGYADISAAQAAGRSVACDKCALVTEQLDERIAKGVWICSMSKRKSLRISKGRSARWNALAILSSGISEYAIS